MIYIPGSLTGISGIPRYTRVIAWAEFCASVFSETLRRLGAENEPYCLDAGCFVLFFLVQLLVYCRAGIWRIMGDGVQAAGASLLPRGIVPCGNLYRII